MKSGSHTVRDAHLLAGDDAASVDSESRFRALFEQTRNPEVGQTYAMAFAAAGRFEEAVKLQQETIIAYERSRIEVSKPFLQQNLALYQRRQPAREPWPADDPLFQPRAPAARLASEAKPS